MRKLCEAHFLGLDGSKAGVGGRRNAKKYSALKFGFALFLIGLFFLSFFVFIIVREGVDLAGKKKTNSLKVLAALHERITFLSKGPHILDKL